MDNVENITLEDAPSGVVPKCPYCKKDLDTIWVKTEGLGIKGQSTILMCPSCQSFLGYNEWKR